MSASKLGRLTPYLYLAPMVGLVGVFLLYPAVDTVWTSLTDSTGIGKANFIGVDNYNTATTSGRTNEGNDRQFQRWFNWAKTKGKPLAVVEFGRLENPNDANARANELLNSETFVRNNNFFMFLYWHGYDEPNQGGVNWGISSGASQNAMRAISSRGKTGW